MPQFKYTAVTQDNQKMTGSLAAADENAARNELNQLGLAILSIDKVSSDEPTPQSTPPQQPQVQPTDQAPAQPKQEEAPVETTETTVFEFEARDKAGKKVIGTIPGKDKLSVIARLIHEYSFDITYLSKKDSPQAEKDHDRQTGVADLVEQAKKLETITKQEEETESQDANFRAKQQALLSKVDYVLEKIKEVLQKFDSEIKPENKKLIQGYIDKLLRIKNSTNLEYIEHTTEELLKKIQDQEIFLHKETLQKEKAALMIESQKLMTSLHSTKSHKPTFIEDLQKKTSGIKIKFVQDFATQIAKKFEPDPEVISLKSIIKANTKQILTYSKIWLKSSGPEAKNQVSQTIRELIQERNKLKSQLKTLQKSKRTKVIKKPTLKPVDDTLAAETANFLGWLLSFYVIYYFVTYYFTQKSISYELPIPWDPNIVNTPLIKYLVAIVFLWYILLAAKTKFAPRAKSLTPVLSVIGLTATALIIFNF